MYGSAAYGSAVYGSAAYRSAATSPMTILFSRRSGKSIKKAAPFGTASSLNIFQELLSQFPAVPVLTFNHLFCKRFRLHSFVFCLEVRVSLINVEGI